jgi:hypothetical protein
VWLYATHSASLSYTFSTVEKGVTKKNKEKEVNTIYLTVEFFWRLSVI